MNKPDPAVRGAAPASTGLFAGLLAGPLGWAIQLGLGYAMLGWACRDGSRWMLHAFSLLALVLALAGSVFAWRMLQAADLHWRHDQGSGAAQLRFMALGAMIVAVFFVLVVVLTWLPLFMLEPCAAP